MLPFYLFCFLTCEKKCSKLKSPKSRKVKCQLADVPELTFSDPSDTPASSAMSTVRVPQGKLEDDVGMDEVEGRSELGPKECERTWIYINFKVRMYKLSLSLLSDDAKEEGGRNSMCCRRREYF